MSGALSLRFAVLAMMAAMLVFAAMAVSPPSARAQMIGLDAGDRA
jgi:hypothetical protein